MIMNVFAFLTFKINIFTTNKLYRLSKNIEKRNREDKNIIGSDRLSKF